MASSISAEVRRPLFFNLRKTPCNLSAKLAKIIFHPVNLFSNAMIVIDTKDIVKEKSVNCLSRLSGRTDQNKEIAAKRTILAASKTSHFSNNMPKEKRNTDRIPKEVISLLRGTLATSPSISSIHLLTL